MPRLRILLIQFMFIVLSSPLVAKETNKTEEVIVTAQKVEENLKDIPISITVFDEYSINDFNIKNIEDIGIYTPNLKLTDMGDNGILTPAIRGISADPHLVTTSVSMYVDGIPTFNSIGFNSIIEDIERIEVLKGPQGTLYGKNAEAGVINIITKKPDNELRGKIGTEFGSDNKKEYSLSASGPIIKNKLYLGISGRYYEKEGFVDNTYLNKRDNDRENKYGKLFLRYAPNENLEISLISSKFERDDGSSSIVLVNSADKYKVARDLAGYNKTETTCHAFKFEYESSGYKIESITSYKEDKDRRATDYDYSPNPFFHGFMNTDYKNTSQELRLSSKKENLNWLIGLFGNKGEEDGGNTRKSLMGERPNLSKLDDASYGVFSHLDYWLNKKLSFTGGLRLDWNEKEIFYENTKTTLDSFSNEISPKLAVKYNLNKDVMTYASITKGHRSGGFFMFAPKENRKYDDEILWNYEIGFKSSVLNNKLIMNTSIYYMDISDQQVLTSLSAQEGYVSNAPSTTSKGIELDINYAMTKKLKIFATLGYNETKFNDFKENIYDPNTSQVVGVENYKDNTTPFAPEFNYSLGFCYRNKSGVFARTDISGYGEMYLDKANRYKQDSYELVNAKAGYESEYFDIYIYGENIFDCEYDAKGYYEGFYTLLSPPREIGVQLVLRF